MGKKGVILDNGKQAQSSMALYWKKQRQNSRKPKKQYQPTEQQALQKQAQSGFQKWKQYKQKAISKALNPKQKHKINKEQKNNQQQQIQTYQKQAVVKSVSIPGFKSKNNLLQKLNDPSAKIKDKVDQSNNVLKVPSGIGSLSQEEIAKILRQKKAKKSNENRRQESSLVKISQDILLGGMMEQQKTQKKPEVQQERPETVQKVQQQQFFKSDILNQIAKGNNQVLKPKQIQIQSKPVEHQIVSRKEQKEEKPIITESKVLKPMFKPRTLVNKTNSLI